MTYLDLKLYLKKNLKSPSLDFIWSKEDNEQFFTFIKENSKADYLKKNKNLLQIKQVFQDHFESVGYILFQIKDFHIKIKILPYTLEPKDSVNVDAIIDILEDNKNLIINDYNGQYNQILIKEELQKKIFEFVQKNENEKINKKELVKFAVREAFELKDSDIVMIKQESIFIKLFDIQNEEELLFSKKNTIADRFNGIDVEELKAFNKEYFSDKESKGFFKLVAKLFVDRYFLGKTIDNEEYETNVFAYIQLIIYGQLTDTSDYSDDFFKGFSGYIFRIHFKEVFEGIAELILAKIATANSYMTKFLKYYSLDIVVFNGVRYKVPNLVAQNGLKWNVVSMLSIVKLYTKTKSSINITNHSIDIKEDEISELYIGELSPVEFNRQIIEKKNKIIDEIVQQDSEIEKSYDALKLTKEENEKNKLHQEISLMKKKMHEVRKKRDELKDGYIGKAEINRFISLDKEIDSLLRQLKNEERILKQNEDAFNSIKTSLVKALTSKKQKL
jgi:hypothetical protein